MTKEPLAFFSDGFELRGDLVRADTDLSERAPLLICSGFTGLKNIHPDRFARALVPRGNVCLGFDYRGFGPSEGPRGHVSVEEQVHDILQATAILRAHPWAAGRAPVLIGWGMGAALVLLAARQLPPDHIAGIACLNGFYDACRVQRAVRGEAGWLEFLAWLDEQRCDAAKVNNRVVDPFQVYPLDDVSRNYVDNVLRKNPDYAGDEVALSFSTGLLNLKVDTQLADMHPWPLFIAHGTDNALHPPQEARALHAAYPGPTELVWLADAGHTEWMLDEHPTFLHLVAELDQWLAQLSNRALT